MIRILHILSSLGWAGEEMVVMNYWRNMDRNEVKFDFVISSCVSERFSEEILAWGGKIHRVPPRYKPHKYIPALFRVIKQNEYKIVHVNHGSASMAVDGFVAKLCGVPVIIGHSHCTNTECLWQHYLFRFFLVNSVFTHRFACSKEAGEWVYGGKRKDVTIINNAVDIKKFIYDNDKRRQIRQDFSIDESCVIGFVGRLERQKNPYRLLQIFNAFLKLKQDSRLLIVGDGRERKGLSDACERMGIQDKVIFAGYRSDVPELMSAMDVFVLPSLYEGLAVVVIEAQVSGLPCVISSVVPSTPNILGNVSLIDLNEPDSEWARAIAESRQVDRTDTVRRLTEAGYDIETEAKKLEDFYMRCHSSKKGAFL